MVEDSVKREMNVPYRGKEITFGSDIVGPGHINQVFKQIAPNYRPTTSQLFALLNKAMDNVGEEGYKEVMRAFNDRYVFSSTENRYARNEKEPKDSLVVIADDMKGDLSGKLEEVSTDKLIEMARSGDERVRLVPYGSVFGPQSREDFLRNPWVIGQLGGADKLDDLAHVLEKLPKYGPKPSVLTVNRVKTEEFRTPTVIYFSNGQLCLDGLLPEKDTVSGCGIPLVGGRK